MLFAIDNVRHMIDCFVLYQGSSAHVPREQHGQPLEKAERKHKESGFKAPKTRLHTARAKGVWVEMGDNMGPFMDVKLLSFSL